MYLLFSPPSHNSASLVLLGTSTRSYRNSILVFEGTLTPYFGSVFEGFSAKRGPSTRLERRARHQQSAWQTNYKAISW